MAYPITPLWWQKRYIVWYYTTTTVLGCDSNNGASVACFLDDIACLAMQFVFRIIHKMPNRTNSSAMGIPMESRWLPPVMPMMMYPTRDRMATVVAYTASVLTWIMYWQRMQELTSTVLSQIGEMLSP